MSQIQCVVLRGLPKEVEEELNKFLASMPGTIHHILQSESSDHVTITVLFEMDPNGDLEE